MYFQNVSGVNAVRVSRYFVSLVIVVAGLSVNGVGVYAQPRQPAGVYAKVLIDEAVASYTGPPENIHICLRQLYHDLLHSDAIQGLTIGGHWDKIQTADATYPDGYDFSYLDDAFIEANKAGKSIQLIITPGFDTPTWLTEQLPDCVWENKVLQGRCGKQQWYKFRESQRADSDMLPLPWDKLYKKKWYAFLEGLNANYAENPAFVAIAVAGPVAASDEIILPTSRNDKHKQPSGLSV
ncbi:MAG TPA: beta-galactosidase, partial [Pyrinomonadaceae bacterium]|nr:beta-galactosidase [Pyrinomonadaceae bacterium]